MVVVMVGENSNDEWLKNIDHDNEEDCEVEDTDDGNKGHLER